MSFCKDEYLHILENIINGAKDNLEELELDEASEYQYGKYMVISEKGTDFEEIYGVFEYEIDAWRRYKQVKIKRNKKNLCVIKANVEFTFLHGIRFIVNYEEI